MDKMMPTKIESPEKMTPFNVCYWYELEGELLGSVKTKVERFLSEGCIQKISENNYICKPIEGYNKTTHKITLSELIVSCSCQAFQRENKECSHIQATKVFKFMENYND